jgi:hypothetical protein
MELIQIDMICLQSFQACFGLGHNVIPGVAPVVRSVSHTSMHFCGKHDPVALAFERTAHDFFRHAIVVYIRGIDEIDACVERTVDNPDAFLLGGRSSEVHTAETEG